MSNADLESILTQFRQALRDCERLYLATAREFTAQYPHLLDRPPQEFLQLMDDLHKGLVIKIYVTVMEADLRWSVEEKELASVLFEHVWERSFNAAQLREATSRVSQDALTLQWQTLMRPFASFAPLREHLGELSTVVMRIANLVAKCDGQIGPGEMAQLTTIQAELDHLLGDPNVSRKHLREPSAAVAVGAVQAIESDAREVRERYALQPKEHAPPLAEPPREEQLAAALGQLDELIGLESVKHEVRTLTNFLNLQRERARAGLPQTMLSLHMVFQGNPGTGKTTVARIVGRILGAMGILKRGHVVETDRSGLVAEYAGQTAPRTNKKIEESLDGVLFVDEAYSLAPESKEDPFGQEALQTLLKRMEDDRQRLVVILAGYPQPMQRLLRSNPGLSSRFGTQLSFEDYRPRELGRIFQAMCDKNHYCAPPEVQARLMCAFQWLYDHRDEHFGNGRLVRNSFENTIRRLANRIVGAVPITAELLSQLTEADVALEGVPADVLHHALDENQRYQFQCTSCGRTDQAPASYFGRRVKCTKCGHRFVAEWAEPVR